MHKLTDLLAIGFRLEFKHNNESSRSQVKLMQRDVKSIQIIGQVCTSHGKYIANKQMI